MLVLGDHYRFGYGIDAKPVADTVHGLAQAYLRKGIVEEVELVATMYQVAEFYPHQPDEHTPRIYLVKQLQRFFGKGAV